MFATTYILSAVGGNLFSAVVLPHTVSVGASSALLGIMGAQLIDLLAKWSTTDPSARRFNLIQSLFVIVLLVAFAAIFKGAYVDWAAHLGTLILSALFSHTHFTHSKYTPGGLIVGICLGTIFFAEQLSTCIRDVWNKTIPPRLLQITFGVLLAGLMVLGFVLVFVLYHN